MEIKSVDKVSGNPPIYNGLTIVFKKNYQGVQDSVDGLVKLLLDTKK